MQLNENTYSYIHRVADQIEGLTCALIVFIENAGTYLESYHYEAFNRFSNEIRDMEISISEEIKNEFLDVKRSIEESALEIRASDSSVKDLKMQLSETEDIFSRLVIHSQNIRVIDSDTSNPYVPNASDEVYRAFSGYNTLLNQYQVNVPDENDYICTLMYLFYCTVNSLFERLFGEYDTLLQNFGMDIEKKKTYTAKIAVKKHDGRKEIIRAVSEVAVITACAISGKKSIFDVGESGIGLVDKVHESLEKVDKVRDTEPKKSLARKVIKGIAVYNDAMELVGGCNEIGEGVVGTGRTLTKSEGADFEIPTFEKLVVAALVTLKGSKELEEWKKSGKLDIVIAGVKTTGNLAKIGSGIVSHNPYTIIKNSIYLSANGLGLVEKTAKHMVKKDIHIKPKAVDKVLHKLGNELYKYEEEVERYKIDKAKKMLAVKKPKAPPFITAKGIVETLRDGMKFYDDISSPKKYKGLQFGGGG